MAKPIPNYHFKQNEDGAIAIEVDAPYEGSVTLTWRPSAQYPGEPIEAVIPAGLFATVVHAYVKEHPTVPSLREPRGV